MSSAQPVPESAAVRAETALRSVLPASTELVVLRRPGPTTSVKVAGRRLRLAWGGEGWRRDIDVIIDQAREVPDIVAARRMSPGARTTLDSAGIGWVDELGNASIAIGTILISRTGHNDPTPSRDPHWIPSVVAVADALIVGTPATVSQVQSATKLSTGSCTNALRTLTDLGLLHAEAKRGRGSARHIVDTDALLDTYAGAAPTLVPPEQLTIGVTWRDTINGVRELGPKFSDLGIRWAATGVVAAALLAPLLANIATAVLYVDGLTVPALATTATRVGLKPIDEGRLTFRPFPTASVQHLSTTVNDIRIAPWPRVYVDVRTAGVRGEEAAEHLRELSHAP